MLSNKLQNNSQHSGTGVKKPMREIFPDVYEIINEACKSIDSIISVSEKDFLEIGEKLQKYSANSRELSQLASRAASHITKDILKNGINELTWLLKQFSEILSESVYKIQKEKRELLSILSNISNVSDKFIGFRKIVKQLIMLGISTKIESSKLGCENTGFFQLAESVDKLSGYIDNKVKVISGKSAFLINEINQTTKNLDRLEQEQKEQLNTILQNTSLSLKTFEDQYSHCSQKANNISESSAGVSKNIRDIVMSIQFHDITRQQMEHAKDALSGLVTINQQNNSDTSTDNVDTIFHTYDVCELQSCQLENSAIEFTSAAQKIIKNLNGVENNISAILEGTSVLLYEKNSDSRLSLESVKTELTTISKGLKNSIQITNNFTTSINSVLKVTEDLSNSITEIEDIGSEIELIAINARIKAAHIGSGGESLGILSEAIQNLSYSTKNQTESIAILLEETSKISRKLEGNLNSINNSSDNNSLEINNEKIHGLMNSMMELEKEADKLIHKLSEDINSLQKEIRNTIEGISMHTYVKESMSVIVGSLNRITILLRPFVDIENKRERNIKNLDTRYTMDQEHRIHQQFINGTIIKCNPDKILRQNEENNFGDNVELF